MSPYSVEPIVPSPIRLEAVELVDCSHRIRGSSRLEAWPASPAGDFVISSSGTRSTSYCRFIEDPSPAEIGMGRCLMHMIGDDRCNEDGPWLTCGY